MAHEISRVLAKIEKLVAMTSSPHIEEARTSAFLACKMIRDHGLQVVAHSANANTEPKFYSTPDPSANPKPSKEFVPIRVKHKSYCMSCKKVIEVGESALWRKGKGLLHFHCRDTYN